MKHSNCKLAINLMQQGPRGPPITNALLQNLYYNDRTGKSSMMDTSRIWIGKASLQNHLSCMKELKFNCMNITDNDSLRVHLKQTFFWRQLLEFIFIVLSFLLYDKSVQPNSNMYLTYISIYHLYSWRCHLLKRLFNMG